MNEQDRGNRLACRGPRLGEEVNTVVRHLAFLGREAHLVVSLVGSGCGCGGRSNNR